MPRRHARPAFHRYADEGQTIRPGDPSRRRFRAGYPCFTLGIDPSQGRQPSRMGMKCRSKGFDNGMPRSNGGRHCAGAVLDDGEVMVSRYWTSAIALSALVLAGPEVSVVKPAPAARLSLRPVPPPAGTQNGAAQNGAAQKRQNAGASPRQIGLMLIGGWLGGAAAAGAFAPVPNGPGAV